MTTPLDLVVDVPVTLESIMQANQIEGYCAKVNGRLKELSAVISGKQLITFLDLHHDEAMRIYET